MLEWLPKAALTRPGAAWLQTGSPTVLMLGGTELVPERTLVAELDDRTSRPAPAAQP